MSAFMVDKAHIDSLVDVALNGPEHGSNCDFPLMVSWDGSWVRLSDLEGRPDTISPSQFGQLLVDANLESIQARYPDCVEEPFNTPGPIDQYWHMPYVWTRPAHRLSSIAALKAIACLEYQSCEHSDWDGSDAACALERMRRCLVGCLPGYSDASWEVDHA